MVFCIGIIVANVPEGLLATVTVSLALTASRMADKMVLVKNLESVETLGSTSCICSDKTGTLTQNRMTVSHIFYDGKTVNADLNLQTHQRNMAKEKPDEKLVLGYDPEDVNLKSLIKSIVLGTYTVFSYSPTEDECKRLHARMKGIPVSKLEGVTIPESVLKDCEARLIEAEKQMLYIHKHCQGDASETGLVQFAQAMYDLDETRGANPVHTYQKGGKTIECKIPFSSDIKFNLFIRDTNPAVKNPTNVDDNLCIFMKGAPERILSRCTKMLIGGEEVEFTDELRNDVNKANSDFGKLGERVLAFARFRLSPEKYSKSSYEFDVRNWKNWGLDVNQKFEDYERVEGSFPMHDLCLMGVVSLNDPPRPMVDLSVNKCRSAGIKVIMVTGDQPPTAAAIAHKVNILKHPELEFNYLVKEMGMTEQDAWEMATGVVVHGDLLAEKHLNEDKLDDLDPEKGRYLLDWIKKKEVVFARTTPS